MTLIAQPLSDRHDIQPLRRRYVMGATAPLDGMWQCGLVPASTHTGLFHDDALVGYYSIDAQNLVLQFHLDASHRPRAADAFAALVDREKPDGAVVSTAEPDFLSLCLDHFPSFEVNALMYQHRGPAALEVERLALEPLTSTHLDEAVDFAHAALGAPTQWLREYYTGLLAREELFGTREHERLIGLGESRGFQGLQPGYADLGVIVAKTHRRRGLATRILGSLAHMNAERDLRPLCSTEPTNTGARRAIERAGFFARNRIVRFAAPK